MDNVKPGEWPEFIIEAGRVKAELTIMERGMDMTSPMIRLEGSL
ncbi:hypothetical protein [Paenibacillus stellifer]|nr:hypothetical protein [Paenibacillus stellifer]